MEKFNYLKAIGNDNEFKFVEKSKREIANKEGYTTASREGFYNTKQWKDLRNYKIKLNPFCERCLDKYNIVTVADLVNHIKPVEKFPELKYDIENLESLCDPCHRVVTILDKYNKREDVKKMRFFEDYGDNE